MKIGTLELGPRPIVLAPMEDVTDRSFRLLCKEQGADMTWSEFVSADALIRDIPSTLRKLALDPGERPTAIQIYGRDAQSMAEAARVAEAAGPDVIDINFGCPVKRVAGKGAGAGMLRNVPLMEEVTAAVARAVSVPVTVKTRLGWDCNSIIAPELAERLQDSGAQAITIHGRTRSQMYTGQADWAAIARVKDNPRLRIPVIGNGDIATAADVDEAFGRWGVDGVMVGRASIGAPWVFGELKGLPPLTAAQKMSLLRRQIAESIDRIDEYRGILHIRRHLAASPLFKGIPNFRPTRIAMLQAATRQELDDILTRIETEILPSQTL